MEGVTFINNFLPWKNKKKAATRSDQPPAHTPHPVRASGDTRPSRRFVGELRRMKHGIHTLPIFDFFFWGPFTLSAAHVNTILYPLFLLPLKISPNRDSESFFKKLLRFTVCLSAGWEENSQPCLQVACCFLLDGLDMFIGSRRSLVLDEADFRGDRCTVSWATFSPINEERNRGTSLTRNCV